MLRDRKKVAQLSTPKRKRTLLVGNGDVVLLRGGLVLRADVQHAVRVDVEGDLDLRYTTRRRRDAVEVELSEEIVVLGHRALALVHLDEHTRLVVGVGREGLVLLGGDGGVALDELSHHATGSLETC